MLYFSRIWEGSKICLFLHLQSRVSFSLLNHLFLFTLWLISYSLILFIESCQILSKNLGATRFTKIFYLLWKSYFQRPRQMNIKARSHISSEKPFKGLFFYVNNFLNLQSVLSLWEIFIITTLLACFLWVKYSFN